jgi:hypothetical protein
MDRTAALSVAVKSVAWASLVKFNSKWDGLPNANESSKSKRPDLSSRIIAPSDHMLRRFLFKPTQLGIIEYIKKKETN